jgi:hypothetical protein
LSEKCSCEARPSSRQPSITVAYLSDF